MSDINQFISIIIPVFNEAESIGYLLDEVKRLLKKYNFEDYHLLGKSYFQTEIVRIQVEEFFLTMSISFFLVFWILLFLFKRI